MFARIGPVIALAILLALAIAFVARFDAAEARGFCLFCAPAAHVVHHKKPEAPQEAPRGPAGPAGPPGPAGAVVLAPKPDEPARPFDPTFCVGVIKAFDTLHPKDLDTFIFSIPEGKREQARRCMTDRK